MLGANDRAIAKLARQDVLNSDECLALLQYISKLKSQRDNLQELVNSRNKEILRLQELVK